MVVDYHLVLFGINIRRCIRSHRQTVVKYLCSIILGCV